MKITTKKEKTKKVMFNLFAPQAKNVSIAGDFNHWNTKSHPMKKDKEGDRKNSFNLPPGNYHYRFFVDGKWQSDPICNNCVENSFGTLNCVKKVE